MYHGFTAKLVDGLPSSALLRLHAAISDEPRDRGVVRGLNNPVGDYTEYLFCPAFHWEQAGNSTKSVDARCSKGIVYHVKGRRITRPNTSRLLSAIRELDAKSLDFFAGVIFAAGYSVFSLNYMLHCGNLDDE